MTKLSKAIVGVIGVVFALYLLVTLTGKEVSTPTLGADVVTNPQWFYNGLSVGVSNETISNVLFGTDCDLSGGVSTLSAGTSTSASLDCAVTGVESGDTVIVGEPSTMPTGWRIVRSFASSTNGYVTVVINNQSATTTIPSTVTQDLPYIIFR